MPLTLRLLRGLRPIWDDGDMRGNCILYALRRWWRDPEHVYLIIRPSRATRLLPHVMVTRSIEGVEVMEFKPDRPKRGWRALLDAPAFRGHVRRGEGEDRKWPLRRRLRKVREFEIERSGLLTDEPESEE